MQLFAGNFRFPLDGKGLLSFFAFIYPFQSSLILGNNNNDNIDNYGNNNDNCLLQKNKTCYVTSIKTSTNRTSLSYLYIYIYMRDTWSVCVSIIYIYIYVCVCVFVCVLLCVCVCVCVKQHPTKQQLYGHWPPILKKKTSKKDERDDNDEGRTNSYRT